MADERVQRKLAAILAADVVGYSQLMEKNEAGTLDLLKRLRREVLAPKTSKFGGHIFKLTGDGAFVEFPSAVDAVQSAIAIQRDLAVQNADLPADQRMSIRIGISLGDVMVDDGDLYGNGVNIAARLEALAQPGGICISGNVHEHIRDDVGIGFQDLGDQHVKNLDRPVRAFRILLDGEPALAKKTVPTGNRAPAWRRRWALASLGAILVVAAMALWHPWTTPTESPTAEGAKPSMPRAAVNPSIAVLPFRNLSDDPEQEYFAEGMAEDIITDLSKLSALFVVPSNSSYRYKGRTDDIEQIGQDLDADYLLEGSVRRAGDRVRINAKLIDVEAGSQIWADRYDGTFADTFALQDKVTSRIIEALSIKLGAEEEAKLADHGTHNIEAHDAFLRGQRFAREYTSEDFALAIKEFERALELDPDYHRATEAIAQIRYIQEHSGLQ
jgi:adenylate cyclase